MTSRPEVGVDVGIITVLAREYNAVVRRLESGEALESSEAALTYRVGKLATADGFCRVGVAQCQGAGNVEASSVTSALIRDLQPAIILLVGIAAGVREESELGDIVLGEYVFAYEPAKLTPYGEQKRPRQYPASQALLDAAREYGQQGWQSSQHDEGPARRVLIGPIAAGEKVLASAPRIAALRASCPKLLAVAMEGTGVAQATQKSRRPPPFLEIRAISDFGDQHKNDGFQGSAADIAAEFAIGFAKTRPFRERRAPAEARHLLVLRGESLREIRPDEITAVLGDAHIRHVRLRFTDLVRDSELLEPERAAQRLVDPTGALQRALRRSAREQLAFHGLLHIPLAILAGKLVTDRLHVRLFDFHPTADNTWKWPDPQGQYPPLELQQMPPSAGSLADIALLVSVSYSVDRAAVDELLPGTPQVLMSVVTPTRGIVRSEAQTRAYGRAVRSVLDRIAADNPGSKRLHLFYAGPVALAFLIGQHISPSIHPSVVAWNYRRPRYEWGINTSDFATGAPSVVWPAPASSVARTDDPSNSFSASGQHSNPSP